MVKVQGRGTELDPPAGRKEFCAVLKMAGFSLPGEVVKTSFFRKKSPAMGWGGESQGTAMGEKRFRGGMGRGGLLRG